jgi:hypothetical protein
MARGRAAFRAGDLSSARTLLVEAAGARDHETAVIARLKLSSVLSAEGELERAHTVLDEVIAACEASSDRLHHCVALNNRMLIWAKRNDLDGSIADQRAATELARIIGHAHVERSCTYNLAELLLWGGCTDEALPLALRSRSLQRRFVGPSPLDALLIARIRAARDELADAAAELAWIDEECESLDGASAMQRTLIGLVVSGTADRAAWEAVIEAARTMNQFYELHEALWFAARSARRAGNEPAALSWIDEGLRLPGSNAVWTTRFQAIASVEDK